MFFFFFFFLGFSSTLSLRKIEKKDTLKKEFGSESE